MGGARCLDGEPPNLGESGVNGLVFNGIAFCYERHTSAGRIRRAGTRERGRRASRVLRSAAILLSGARPSRRSKAEAEEQFVARSAAGVLGLGMQWLDQLPFADNRVVQIGFLAACGIAALIVLAILYRLAFAHRLRVPGGRTRQPRLGLVDAFSLDGQRQLVLVRRDNVEHLVMIGGPNDVLVESQINRAWRRRARTARLRLCSRQALPDAEPRRPWPLRRSSLKRRRRRSPRRRLRPPRRQRRSRSRRPRPQGAAPPQAPTPAAPKPPATAVVPASSKAPATTLTPAPGSPRPQPRQTKRTGARAASRLRSAPGRAIAGAGPRGAGEFAAAAASPGASRDASADRSRERLRHSGDRRSADGEGSPEAVADSRRFADRILSRARAAAPREGGTGCRSGRRAARNAVGGGRRRGQPGVRPGAAPSEDATARGCAEIRRTPPAGRKTERSVKRQAAGEGRRSVRRPRFARSGNGASARPRKAELTLEFWPAVDSPSEAGVPANAPSTAALCSRRERAGSDRQIGGYRERERRERIVTRRDKFFLAARAVPAPRPKGSRSASRRGA